MRTNDAALNALVSHLQKGGLLPKPGEPGAEALETVDVFDPKKMAKSIEQRINALVAKGVRDALEPVANAQRAEVAKRKVEEFIRDEAPELHKETGDQAFRTEVHEMLKANESMTLKTAYEVVKARHVLKGQRTEQEELVALREAARAHGLMVGRGSSKAKGPTLSKATEEKGDAYDIYEELMRNKT